MHSKPVPDHVGLDPSIVGGPPTGERRHHDVCRRVALFRDIRHGPHHQAVLGGLLLGKRIVAPSVAAVGRWRRVCRIIYRHPGPTVVGQICPVVRIQGRPIFASLIARRPNAQHVGPAPQHRIQICRPNAVFAKTRILDARVAGSVPDAVLLQSIGAVRFFERPAARKSVAVVSDHQVASRRLQFGHVVVPVIRPQRGGGGHPTCPGIDALCGDRPGDMRGMIVSRRTRVHQRHPAAELLMTGKNRAGVPNAHRVTGAGQVQVQVCPGPQRVRIGRVRCVSIRGVPLGSRLRRGADPGLIVPACVRFTKRNRRDVADRLED